eukprot:scaffold64236_cov51-Attheya_sp.AAC.1
MRLLYHNSIGYSASRLRYLAYSTSSLLQARLLQARLLQARLLQASSNDAEASMQAQHYIAVVS